MKIPHFLASTRRSVLWLVPALAWLAAPASAEPLAAPAGGLATVRITGSTLEPGRMAVGPAQHVVFRNDAPVMARVELDLPRGEGILCRSGGDGASRGRKFVVGGGDVLECEAPPSKTRYRVFRVGAGGSAPVASVGELEPASR